MRYLVKGADRKTGDLTSMTIEADSPAAAERIANARGILVSQVEESATQHLLESQSEPAKRMKVGMLVTAVVAALVGYLIGREHVKYQMR